MYYVTEDSLGQYVTEDGTGYYVTAGNMLALKFVVTSVKQIPENGHGLSITGVYGNDAGNGDRGDVHASRVMDGQS
jgi:hypothetical protein